MTESNVGFRNRVVPLYDRIDEKIVYRAPLSRRDAELAKRASFPVGCNGFVPPLPLPAITLSAKFDR